MSKQKESITVPSHALHLVRDVPTLGSATPSWRGPTRQRLDNQLARALRNSYGAEQGLRVVVRVATQELLRAGMTRSEVHATLSSVVAEHPGTGASRSSLVTGRSRAESLASMIVRWSDLVD